jgi:menaquinone-dependent protoporphyrinogen oxidase
MSRILIVYATTHGQTAKIAKAMADTLRTQAVTVCLFDVAHAHPHPDDFDGVIVAASVHAGKYQKPIVRWVRSHDTALNARPTAFISVCLGVLQHSPDVDRALRAIEDHFLEETGWQPKVIKPVAGALRYTQYNWFLRQIMKRIVRKAGGDTDTSRDYEYTNWRDLSAFTTGFRSLVEAPHIRVPVAIRSRA